MARCVFGVPLILLLVSVAFGQNPPQSDPQAVSFASQSIAALTGGNAVNDVTLTGSVTWSGGDVPETGTATLLAAGRGESRMDLALPSGTRTEIRDASTGEALGKWIAPNASSGLFEFQNCATDAAWFFPALSSLAGGPSVILTYVGQEIKSGISVQHLQSYVYQSNAQRQTDPTPQQLSTMDFYLDATTLLPVAVTFNAHPDNNPSVNLPVEVDFSNYQAFSGFQVPMHTQRFLQGNLLVDLTLSSVSFNTGLSLSTFAVN